MCPADAGRINIAVSGNFLRKLTVPQCVEALKRSCEDSSKIGSRKATP